MDIIKNIIKYRQLILALTARQLQARYRGSVLGFLWSFLNPLFLMLIYTLVFKFYIRFSQVDNYSLFLFCGLLPWIWTSGSLIEGSVSITSSGHLITKALFPAEILPTISVLNNLIHFLLSLPVLLIFILFFNNPIYPSLILLPLVIFFHFIFLLGLSLIFSALNVFYRDIQHLVGNILNFLFFLSPIIYPATVVPKNFWFTIELNPFAQFTIIYQNLILYNKYGDKMLWIMLVGSSIVSFTIGSVVFNRYKERFSELL